MIDIEYANSSLSKFISDYEKHLLYQFEEYRLSGDDEIDYSKIEQTFIKEIFSFIELRNQDMLAEMEIDSISVESKEQNVNAMLEYNFKIHFLDNKLQRLHLNEKLEATFNRASNIPTSNSLLLNGKKLNLLDRFILANHVLNIDAQLRTLNVGDLEKYQLLAYILGCNKDNARDLMNGAYNATPHDLTSYLTSLGK